MCVLRVSSNRHSLSAFLAAERLPYYESHAKHDPQPYGRKKGKPFGHSGFKSAVSDKEWSDLPGQIHDALRFLKRHRNAIVTLRKKYGVKDMRLDFPNALRIGTRVAAQFDYFPPELILLTGKLGLGIQLSLYPASTKRKSVRRKLK
jgi:hypothetical protein